MRIIKFNEIESRKTVNLTIKLTDAEWNRFKIQDLDASELLETIPKIYKPAAIQEVIYSYFDLNQSIQDKMTDSKELGRFKHLVEVRRYCFYFLRKYTKLSYAQIGKLYDMKHSNIIHHLGVIENDLELNVKRTIDRLDEIDTMIKQQLETQAK